MNDPPPSGMDLVLRRYLAFTYYVGDRRLAAAGSEIDAAPSGSRFIFARRSK
jgi:hypothetical protein